MQTSAIIVAAGSGSRLGTSLPKAFVPLAGHPILFYSLRTLTQLEFLGEIILAVPSGMEKLARALVNESGLGVPVKITAGGNERQDSVRLALALTSAEARQVVIHDAARPFATVAHFRRCLQQAEISGAAIAAIPVADTLKRVERNGLIAGTLPRAGLWQAQTPQAFEREVVIAAHAEAYRLKITATDDADLVERLGHPVAIVDGSPTNLKITNPDDLMIAEALAVRLFPH
jgi:2-C-methyl-D-erythritol 4-phosphate cytidylyltransferase